MTYNEFEGRPDLEKKRQHVHVLRSVFLYCFVVYVVVLLAVVATNAVISISTRGKILDCTQADGVCYQQQQQRSVELIKQLIDDQHLTAKQTQHIVVLAAACADQDGSSSATKIEACVNARLRLEGNK